jgi:hypothetical protein
MLVSGHICSPERKTVFGRLEIVLLVVYGWSAGTPIRFLHGGGLPSEGRAAQFAQLTSGERVERLNPR